MMYDEKEAITSSNFLRFLHHGTSIAHLGYEFPTIFLVTRVVVKIS